MFNPTIELQEVDGDNINTILTKEIQLEHNAFPEVVIWHDKAYALEDFEPMIHAVYVAVPFLKIAYEPVNP